MDEGPQSLLTRIIDTHSPEIINERVRLVNLLNDSFKSNYKKEKNTLVASLEEGIPGELVKSHTCIPTPILVSQLAKRLTENRGISDDLATWSVKSWALALHIAVEEPTTVSSDGRPTATFTLNTTPSGAEIYLDGRPVGQTPLRINDVEPGSHVIRCSLDGYQDQSITSAVRALEDRHHAITLKPLAQTRGEIAVESFPSGCAVHLDAVYQGLTPLRLQSVAPGRHFLTCSHHGYEDATRPVDVQPNTLHTINIPLDKVKTPVTKISIVSRPSRSTIFIDKQKMGETPITADVPKPGSVSVVCVHPGYRTWRKDVIVQAGAPNSLSITLMPEETAKGNWEPSLIQRPAGITLACVLVAVPSFFLVMAIFTDFMLGLFGVWGLVGAYYLYKMNRRAKFWAGSWVSFAFLFLLAFVIGMMETGLDPGSAVMAFVILSLPFVGVLAVLYYQGPNFV